MKRRKLFLNGLAGVLASLGSAGSSPADTPQAAPQVARPAVVSATAQTGGASENARNPIRTGLATGTTEDLLPPEPLVLARHESVFAESCCGDPRPARRQWFLTGLGGVSYIDNLGPAPANPGNGFGGYYGLLGGLQIWRAWGLVGSIAMDHGTGDSGLARIGIIKTPVFHPTNRFARLSYYYTFDQYWTNRPQDIYLSQFRGEIAYHVNCRTAFGVRFAQPIAEQNPGAGRVFVDPATLASIGALRAAESYTAFGTVGLGETDVTVEAGALVDPDAFLIGAHGERALTDNLAAYANASYDDRGVWSGTVGVRLRLGGRRSEPAPCVDDRCCGEVVRGGLRGDPEEVAALSVFGSSVSGGSSGPIGSSGFSGFLFPDLARSFFLNDPFFGTSAERVTTRQRNDPGGFERTLPQFYLGFQGGGAIQNPGMIVTPGGIDFKTTPSDKLVAALIQQAGLVPGQGLGTYLANPAFNALTQALADNNRFNDSCHQLAMQLQMSAADRISLCGS